MSTAIRVLPGRAGRLRLQHQIATAERGAELLDHKLRILRVERERLTMQLDRTAAAWQNASREADAWLVRGVLLGGERGGRLSAVPALAEVTIEWEQSMGVRYPVKGTCAVPERSPVSPPMDNAALVTARDQHRRALQAGVQQAVIEAADRVLEAEERATRRRLRAIEDRLLPRMREALAGVQLKLDEEEHDDGVRLRWAARHRVAPGRAGTSTDASTRSSG
jgi:V/A-type H+-transporting ATPase subunit D